jgi:hypothetical protein
MRKNWDFNILKLQVVLENSFAWIWLLAYVLGILTMNSALKHSICKSRKE